MWFWWWVTSDKSLDWHKALLVAAFVAGLIGGGVLTLAAMRGEWREATAQVLSVETVCELSSSDGTVRRTTTRLVVPCTQVEQFRRDNAGRSWSLTRYEQGRVRLTGEGADVVVEMRLAGYFGANPQVGDRASILQDPGNPTRTSVPEGQMHLSIAGYAFLALAGFLAAVAFMWF